jgi:hypothetical protein
MTWLGFGEVRDGIAFKVVDERVVRGSAGLMLLLGSIAAINGFILKNYGVLPWLSGFLVLNFALGVLVGPKVMPTFALARLLTWRQQPLWVGAVQKRFAWSLGLALSLSIFGLSFELMADASWFNAVCRLCLICILFLYLESAFGICVGCQLYKLALRLKLVPRPEIVPNCTGDACAPER